MTNATIDLIIDNILRHNSSKAVELLLGEKEKNCKKAQARRAVNSDAQKEAARINGRKGGRPKKR